MSNVPVTPKVVTVDDFSGGMTDFPIGENNARKYFLAENLTINENKKLESRPGSELADSVNNKVPSNDRIQGLFELNGKVFVHANRSVFEPTNSGYTDFTNQSFFNTDTTIYNRACFQKINNIIYTSNDTFSNVKKVFYDENGDIQWLNAGLPDFKLSLAINFANNIKNIFTSHIQDNSQHPSIDTDSVITAQDAFNLSTLLILTNELIVKYNNHIQDVELANPNFHIAQGAQGFNLNDDIVETLEQALERLEKLKVQFNLHDADTVGHSIGSTNQMFFQVNPVVTGNSGTNTYLYGFHYEYRYSVGETTRIEQGPVVLMEAKNLDDPDFTISQIPILVNGSDTKYDTAKIRIVIGRSQANGDLLYKTGEILNGVTTFFIDSTSDQDLVNNSGLYIEGGVLDNEPPPPCKYLKVVNDVMVMAQVKEGSVIRKNRVRYSKRFQPSSCPAEFYDDFETEVTGVGRRGVYLIIFEKNRMFRMEGFYDTIGTGGYLKREISNETGCISHESIVEVEEGILFAAEDGIYFTNAFDVYRISNDLTKRFPKYSNKTDIVGTYDKERKLVIFSLKSDESLDYNDTLLVGHTRYRKNNNDLPFTVWNDGQNKSDNFSATTVSYLNQTLLRGDFRGYLLKHDRGQLGDVVIDDSKTPDNFNTRVIRYDLTTISTDFGSKSSKKWVPKIILNAENISNLSLDIFSSNDNDGLFIPIKPVLEKGNIFWGDPSIIWNVTNLRWNYLRTTSAMRRFNSSSLRCQYKQLKFTNAYTQIISSRSFTLPSLATVDKGLKTVSLDDYPNTDWGIQIEELFISFSDDDYVSEFRIIDNKDGVLTLDDSSGNLRNLSSIDWKINGFNKNEFFSLLDYSIDFSYLTASYKSFRSS